MNTVFTLDWRGLLTAIGLGILLFVLGGAEAEGLLFLAVMLFFLIISAIASRIGATRKLKIGAYEHVRGWRNVVANGIVPLFVALLYFASMHFGSSTNGTLFEVAFLASVASITADKFSSEIGVLDKKVYMLVGMNKVKPGTSGGVSKLGMAAGLLGAACIAGLSLVCGVSAGLCLLIVVSGFLGNVADSIFGYFEDKGIGNKYTTNITCAASGALVVLVALWVLELLI